MNHFQKAERSQVFLKLAITGPTGSGKTFSALRLAMGLIEGTEKRAAFIDTENDSASLYSPGDGEEADGIKTFDFDVMPIAPPFPPEHFATGILASVNAGYGAVIIDSASHFWKGILAFKDQLDSHGKGNSFTNWKEADRKFDPVIESVLQSKIHVIFCMRSKMDYVLESDAKGKQVPKKVGLAPIMRDNLEYEFSTVLDIGLDHSAQASKDRTGLFPNDKIFQVTEQTGRDIAAWLKSAKPKPEMPVADASKPQEASERRDSMPEAEKHQKTKDALIAFLEVEQCDPRSFLNQAHETLGTIGEPFPSFSDLPLPILLMIWKARKGIVAAMRQPSQQQEAA